MSCSHTRVIPTTEAVIWVKERHREAQKGRQTDCQCYQPKPEIQVMIHPNGKTGKHQRRGRLSVGWPHSILRQSRQNL